MTGNELRQTRQRLGLSRAQLGELLGGSSPLSDRTIARREELGDSPIPFPEAVTARLIALLMEPRGPENGSEDGVERKALVDALVGLLGETTVERSLLAREPLDNARRGL